MALTNVWRRDKAGEWVQTSAVEADQLFPHTVSAYSRTFRCLYCYQYVTFTQGQVNTRHFRHSSSEQNKICEERSHSAYTPVKSIEKLINMPLRLQASDNQYSLELGFLPLRQEALQSTIQAGLRIHIDKNKPRSLSHSHDQTYVVDPSRFTPHTTTWLPLPINWAYTYHLSFSQSTVVPTEWRSPIIQIGFNGVLFHADTGRMIPERSDVAVNRHYLWLCRRSSLPMLPSEGLEYRRLSLNVLGWMLYQLTPTSTSASVSDFFFDTLHVRLTNYPPELFVVWPPVLEQDDTLDSNAKQISMLMQGDALFAAYPVHHASYAQKKLLNGMSFVTMKTGSALQLVCAERNQQRLLFRYLRPLEKAALPSVPGCSITNVNGETINEDKLLRPPPHGIIDIRLPVDGWIDVSDKNGFLFRTKLPADKTIRLYEIKVGQHLTVHAGLDIVREVSVVQKRSAVPSNSITAPPWMSSRSVVFDHRHAGVLERIPAGSELYTRVINALRQGQIPEDGWKYLLCLMEE